VVAPPCHPFRSADLQILAIEQAEDERVVEELLDLGHPAWILKQLADAASRCVARVFIHASRPSRTALQIMLTRTNTKTTPTATSRASDPNMARILARRLNSPAWIHGS